MNGDSDLCLMTGERRDLRRKAMITKEKKQLRKILTRIIDKGEEIA